MTLKKTIFCFGAVALWLLVTSISFGASLRALEMEKQEYKQELARIEAFRKPLTPGPTNDLKKYEEFADKIQKKWNQRNKEYYAHLMLEVCKPLSSGRFKDDERYQLARKYALSALADPNKIPLETELELTGHVVTLMIGPNTLKGQMWSQLRTKDVQIRIHACKRLIDAIDPNWDPNEMPLSPNAVAAAMGLPGAVVPEAIKDPKLRAEYEAAIQRNRQKIKRYREQYRLRKWEKRFLPSAERYIVRAYSKPPFNSKELKGYLDKNVVDKKRRARILAAVEHNIGKLKGKM